jgi:type IV fimbrial biogenesis protein FimT
LIELLVTIAVAAVLISLAVPSFRVFVQNSRIATQTNDLVTDISFARSEAIKSGATASLCTSAAGLACDGGGNWSAGRLVWVDTNGNNALDAGEVRRFREQLAGANTLNVTPATDPLTFNNRGTPTGGAAAAITFSVCDDRGVADGRDVTVNPLGQTRASGPPATLCP